MDWHRKEPGPWFNIKMSSYQYMKSHCGDKTVVRSSYLHNGISYTGKMTSLYWIRAQGTNGHCIYFVFSEHSGFGITRDNFQRGGWELGLRKNKKFDYRIVIIVLFSEICEEVFSFIDFWDGCHANFASFISRLGGVSAKILARATELHSCSTGVATTKKSCGDRYR